MKKYFIFVVSVLFLNSCCKGKYVSYSYIGGVTLKNEKRDSISGGWVYFYDNDTTFSKPKDSNTHVGINQIGNDLDLSFDENKLKQMKQFKYVLFNRTKIIEYKVNIVKDGCKNCGDCDEYYYPEIVEINGVRKINPNNSLTLN